MAKEDLIFVSDHDGTLTNADQEASHYDEIVLAYLVSALNIKEIELAPLLLEAKDVIRSKPNAYGWKRNGFIVAPATADHYIFNIVSTEMVLEKLRKDALTKPKSLPTKEEQGAFTSQLFQTTSAKLGEAGSFYREDAKEYINELSAAGAFAIVTNSSTETVAAKLETLLGDGAANLQLVGNARKYDVDPKWTGVVPEGKVDFPGFPDRGVFLQRRVYYEALENLAEGDINRIRICGDIPELNTLMADYLGCQTALVEGDTTSAWEKAYYNDGNSKRFASPDLIPIAEWMIKE
jgi:hypothetical protein